MKSWRQGHWSRCGSRSRRGKNPSPARASWNAIRWQRCARSTAFRSPSKTTSTFPACRLPRRCPAFSYTPGRSATVVQALIDAGAIPIGKTNMDQFATGLVGTRSPHGACSSVFDRALYFRRLQFRIRGGGGFRSCEFLARHRYRGVGTRSRGFQRAGGVEADARHAERARRGAGVPDARLRLGFRAQQRRCAHGLDASPEASTRRIRIRDCRGPARTRRPGPRANSRSAFRRRANWSFSAMTARPSLYAAALARLESLGGRKVEIDFSIFRAAAELLYSGPWVAERYAAIREFIEQHADEMNPVVRGIIEGARRYSAADAFAAEYALRDLRRAAEAQWERMDVMVLPTAATIYTHEEVAADPVGLNTNLGLLHEFRQPAGSGCGGRAGGISSQRSAVRHFAGRPGVQRSRHCWRWPDAISALPVAFESACPPGCVAVAVVGAHLTGQPLNWQLTDRGARRLKACRTAPYYRLYALDGTMPRQAGAGARQRVSRPRYRSGSMGGAGAPVRRLRRRGARAARNRQRRPGRRRNREMFYLRTLCGCRAQPKLRVSAVGSTIFRSRY